MCVCQWTGGMRQTFSEVHSSPVVEWHAWVDRIESERRMDVFRVGPTASPSDYNAYRQGVRDAACMEVFRETHPTKRTVSRLYGSNVVQVFNHNATNRAHCVAIGSRSARCAG